MGLGWIFGMGGVVAVMVSSGCEIGVGLVVADLA